MKSKKTYAVMAAVIMLIGIIVAFTCELDTSGIYDTNVGAITANVGTHIFVIMLFVIASVFLLYLYCKSVTNNVPKNEHFIFLGTYCISGFFFALASGYQARAKNLSGFYSSINSAPGWYSSEFTNESWFHTLPEAAVDFSSTATVWYCLMFVSIVVTIVLARRAFPK